MKKIPIVLSGDEKIFFTIAVVIVSLLENRNPSTFYDINVLCSEDVAQKSKELLLKLKEKYSNFSLTLYDVKDRFKDIQISKEHHVNFVAANRMLIPQIFKNYDKILYLDTDIIVRGDLAELFETDLEDNYLGGISAVGACLDNDIYNNICSLLEIPNTDFYINSGVMLMNLKKIREDKIDEKWMSLLGKYENSVDQHIINKVCFGKIKMLPIKYNICLSSMKYYKTDAISVICSLKEAKEAYENPVIFHWTHVYKPWLYNDTYFAQEWYKYYKMITPPPPSQKYFFAKDAAY